MTRKQWNKADTELLKKLASRMTIREVAETLGRTYSSIEKKAHRLGIKFKEPEQNIIVSAEGEIPQTVKIKKEAFKKLVSLMGTNLLDSLAKREFEAQKVKLLTKYSKNKKDEESILVLSDMHLGMVNKVFDSTIGKRRETYNFEIYRNELKNLKTAIFQIHGLLSNAYNLRRLNIFLLGDIVTNDRIFSGQEFHIDRCVGDQIWDGVATIAQLIQELKLIYETIEVTGVVGNHGRTTDTYKTDEPVENNFEYHLYKILEMIFAKDPRVKIVVPNTRQYIVTVAGWRHLLQHGDTFRGTTRNYMERQVKDLIVNVGGFDVLETAHVHSCEDSKVGEHIRVKQNGCWIEKDNYAFKVYKMYSVPEQHFYGCNKKRPETWAYKLDLRG
ncbi:MAG: hypothetical protein ACFFAU_01165 [Candidatus Hodarchaeota archaeon]